MNREKIDANLREQAHRVLDQLLDKVFEEAKDNPPQGVDVIVHGNYLDDIEHDELILDYTARADFFHDIEPDGTRIWTLTEKEFKITQSLKGVESTVHPTEVFE